MKRAAALVIVAAVSAGAAMAAQQAGFTRTPLKDQPISVAGHHGVTARVGSLAPTSSRAATRCPRRRSSGYSAT